MVADAAWMTETQARFQTRVTLATPSGPAIVKLLDADAQRFWLHIDVSGGAANVPQVWPGPLPAGFNPTASNVYGGPFKFKDCPSVVCGEWYVLGDGLSQYVITECLLSKG